MPHGPFILGAYAFALVALAWCALAPVRRGRNLAAALRARQTPTESADAPET